MQKFLRWLNFGLALMAGALALYWIGEMYRGTPDRYPNEHATGLGISLGMLIGCIGSLVKQPALKATFAVGSLLMVFGVLGLMFGNRS